MYHVKMIFWNKKEAKRFFQELPIYHIVIEKTRIKHVKDVDLLHELPFYGELSIVKIAEAFKRYEKSYQIEIID